MAPVIKLIKGPVTGVFYEVRGTEIVSQEKGLFTHPENLKWSQVAAVSEDETRLAVCDTAKNLFCFSLEAGELSLLAVPMRLAKTATGLCFTHIPSKNALLVADKFGDVLRFEDGQDFEAWAKQSQVNSKALSIHTHKKRSHAEAEAESDKEEANNENDKDDAPEAGEANEAHHCTIIGHISMITDLAVVGDLIVTCDRDEKVRFTSALKPERIHSFGLAHRQYVASLASCEATGSVFSAGGDDFICEWKPEATKTILVGKIMLPRGNVQEVKVSKCGRRLLAWFLGDQICEFEKNDDGAWELKATQEAKTVTAVCFADGVVEVRCGEEAELEATLEQISKTKLRKDIERMDWKLKRHEKRQD